MNEEDIDTRAVEKILSRYEALYNIYLCQKCGISITHSPILTLLFRRDRKDDNGENVEEFLVKWKGQSYLHLSWVCKHFSRFPLCIWGESK